MVQRNCAACGQHLLNGFECGEAILDESSPGKAGRNPMYGEVPRTAHVADAGTCDSENKNADLHGVAFSLKHSWRPGAESQHRHKSFRGLCREKCMVRVTVLRYVISRCLYCS